MMNVTSCCGYYSVKTGIFIIGILTVICSLISLISTTIMLPGVLYILVPPLVHMVCGILLIVGMQERKVELVFPSVCTYFGSITLLLPTIFVYSIQFAATHRAPLWLYLIIIFIAGICFALTVCIFMVITTLYKELLRQKYTVSKIDNYLDVCFSNEQQQ